MSHRPLVRLPVRAWDGFSRHADSWAEVNPRDVVAVRPYPFQDDDRDPGANRCRVELRYDARPVECTLPADEVLDLLWPPPPVYGDAEPF